MGLRQIGLELPYTPRRVFEPLHGMKQRFGCIVAHRRAGKTVATIRQLERASLLCERPNPRFAYIAPLYKQAKDVAWTYLKQGAGPILKYGAQINETELRVDYPNGGRVRLYGGDNPDSLRGIYLDGVVLDESADMDPALWSEVIRPALADRQGWAMFIGTPKGRNAFYHQWRNALSQPDEWLTLMLKASETGLVKPEELEAAGRVMSPSQYAREFECSFEEPNVDQFISSAIVEEARARQTSYGEPVVLGIDVARFGDDRTVFLVRKGDRVTLVQRRHGLDLMQTAGRAAELINEHKPQAVFVDGVGVGGGVVDRLRQLGFKVIDVSSGSIARDESRFSNLRAEMWSKMRDWLKDRGAIPPEEHELADDLACLSYDYDHRNRLKLEKKDDLKVRGLPSPDSADALALTFAAPVATQDVSQFRVYPTTANVGHAAAKAWRRRRYGLQ